MDEPKSSLEKITDSITDVISGVPAPVRKNFLKALGQLCTAAVDVPVTWLEGKASTIKATFEARVQIIKKQGENISEKIEAPEMYVAKASEKFASKIIKEQLNLDEITRNAAQNLADHKHEEQPRVDGEKKTAEPEIGDDWLNEFENYARLKSSEDMKIIFGKILSGEIIKPGTFSIKTIRLISQLDNKAAKLFQSLCSLSVTMEIAGHPLDTRVVSLNGNAASNSISKYGLSFDNLNILQEYGLIITDFNSYYPYTACLVNEKNQVGAVIKYKDKAWGLKPIDKEKYDKTVNLHGVAFTRAARELKGIIPLTGTSQYDSDLVEYFQKKHLNMVEIHGYK